MTTPENFSRVRALFHSALEVAPEARAAYVRTQSDDAAVVQEVESLLAAYPAAEGFLSAPGAASAPAASVRLPAGMRLGAYEILDLVGAGGMGEVYRAHDPRLDRDVAIKVLPAHLGHDREAVARLTREARAVAALSHPGILTIHDIGEVAGQVYFVTELLDGETLRQRLSRGPLPWRDALDVGIAMAQGLAAAHAAGIVHRDLKPENVFVTRVGTVKILDFGVAKSMAHGRATTKLELTAPGAAIGTLAYMAPEQLEGREIDHRTDQFAFGILLHELLAGRHPYPGESAQEIAASILRDTPPPVSDARPDVPGALSRVVSRCLARAASQRYASTADLTLALGDVRDDASAGATIATRPSQSRRPLAWAVGAGLAVLLGAFGLRALSTTAADRAPDSIAAAAGGGTAPQVVAVLPFNTIGEGEPYLADGVTESVTRELGRVKSVRVLASNTAFAYRDRAGDLGRDHDVALLVRGSVQRAGDRVRISATLVDTGRNETLWTERYDRDRSNVFSLQDDIAWQVAAHLAESVGGRPPERPSPSQSTTPEAYDAYLRGMSHMRSRSGLNDTGPRLAAGIAGFEQAVSIDPNFALAHAMLASAYTQQFFYVTTDPTYEHKAFVEIEKALAINPDQAEAYLARAQIVWNVRNGFQHEHAIADLKRAIAHNPSLAEAHVELGKIYFHIGLTDKAVAANEEALRLDPMAISAEARRLGAILDAGRFDEVRVELARNPRWLRPLGRAHHLYQTGRADEAMAIVEGVVPHGLTDAALRERTAEELAGLAEIYAATGRRTDASRAIAAAVPRLTNPTGLSDLHHAQVSIGCAYALLGQPDEAVRWLTKAADEGYPAYPMFVRHVGMAPLKNHAGYQALLERLRRDWEHWRATL